MISLDLFPKNPDLASYIVDVFVDFLENTAHNSHKLILSDFLFASHTHKRNWDKFSLTCFIDVV